MTWKREILKALFYSILCLALVLLSIRGFGYKLGFRPVDTQRTSPSGEVDFGGDGAVPRLEQDFLADSRPQNIIFMLGDGMGFGHLLSARAELVGLNRRLQLERMPISGWLTTHARTSLGTDSAASATALATGRKVRPGRLSLAKGGEVLRTLAEEAIARGMSVGLITDSYLEDASLGAFVSHVESRREYAEVTRQMAASGAELLAGTLRGDFVEGSDEGQAHLAAFTDAGYSLVRDWQTLERHQTPGKLAILFPKGHISDRQRTPNLSLLVDLAIERLSRNPGGFFLVVETEETDTASHAHDFQRMVRGIESLDEAAARALDFARDNRQTLVLATADHETGGLMPLNASPNGKLEVEWGVDGHVAVPVPLLAYGPGAELLGGDQDNTEVAQRLAALMGFDLQRAGEIR